MTYKELIAAAVSNLKPATRYRLAKTLGITPSAVYEWQSGRAKPTGDHVLKLIELGKKKHKGSATVAMLVTLAILAGTILWAAPATVTHCILCQITDHADNPPKVRPNSDRNSYT